MRRADGVLAEPITRLIYQRGSSAPRPPTSPEALFWWSLSLPFQGASLLFSRTFFSLQRPWATTALAGVNLVNLVALALYEPFEIAGIVLATVVGTDVMCVAQGWILRGALGGSRVAGSSTPWCGCPRGSAAGRRRLRGLVRLDGPRAVVASLP